MFKTKDEILVRNSNSDFWTYAIFSHERGGDVEWRYVVSGGMSYKYAIPYAGNESLVGTTSMPKDAWVPALNEIVWAADYEGTDLVYELGIFKEVCPNGKFAVFSTSDKYVYERDVCKPLSEFATEACTPNYRYRKDDE